MPTQPPQEKLLMNAIMTASREELTLMLYDGALKFCNQAIISLENKQYEKANASFQRVQDIIREFQITLDQSYGISKYFYSMYEYMRARIVDANMNKDIKAAQEVRDYIREFRDTWKEAMKVSKQSRSAAANK